jgi:4-amino-4-deoxy-L-arabinose transferase-like glycosyltransferase
MLSAENLYVVFSVGAIISLLAVLFQATLVKAETAAKKKKEAILLLAFVVALLVCLIGLVVVQKQLPAQYHTSRAAFGPLFGIII